MKIYGGENLESPRMKIHGGEIIEINTHRWKSMMVKNWSKPIDVWSMVVINWNAHRCLICGGEFEMPINGGETLKGPQIKIYGGDNLKGPMMKIYGGKSTEMPLDVQSMVVR